MVLWPLSPDGSHALPCKLMEVADALEGAVQPIYMDW